MGCFVSCFRNRDRDRRIQLRATSRPTSDSYFDLESLEERSEVDNKLGYFFLTEEKDTEEDVGHPFTLDEELRLEAKNLKLCGAIPETPMEIRKVNKRIALQELNGSGRSPNSASTLSNKKIQLGALCGQENRPGQTITGTPDSGKESPICCQNTPGTGSGEEMRGGKLDLTPVRLGKGIRTSHQLGALCEQENSPCQIITGAPDSGKETPICHHNTSGTGSGEEMRGGKLDLTPVRLGKGIRTSHPNSPFPTPVTLTNDMQTPATIYSSYQEAPATGKWARIRTQYAYPALKPAQREEITSSIQSVVEKEIEVAGLGTKRSSDETPKILVSGPLKWLKPMTALRGKNGIPNSTRKYKEDQKVKWHSTPFVERLEKVLSDENMPAPRKLI